MRFKIEELLEIVAVVVITLNAMAFSALYSGPELR